MLKKIITQINRSGKEKTRKDNSDDWLRLLTVQRGEMTRVYHEYLKEKISQIETVLATTRRAASIPIMLRRITDNWEIEIQKKEPDFVKQLKDLIKAKKT